MNSMDANDYVDLLQKLLGETLLEPSSAFRTGYEFVLNCYQWYVKPRVGDFDFSIVNSRNEFESLARLLIEAGIAMTPAIASTGDIRPVFALLRYAEYFRNNDDQRARGHCPCGSYLHFRYRKLTLDNNIQFVSSRLKALMAEELSSGIACYLLKKYFNVVHIVDYQSEMIEMGISISGQFPDFYCATNDRNLLLVEVKGTVAASQDSMSSRLKKGEGQVCCAELPEILRPPININRDLIDVTRLVIGTCFCTTPGLETRTYVRRARCQHLSEVRAGISSRPRGVIGSYSFDFGDCRMLSYAKIFRYLGLDSVANAIVQRIPFELVTNKTDIDSKKYTVMGSDMFGNVLLLESMLLEELGGTIRADERMFVSSEVLPEEKILGDLGCGVLVLKSPFFEH